MAHGSRIAMPGSRPRRSRSTGIRSSSACSLAEIDAAGLWKHERMITSPQGAHVTTNGKRGAQLLRQQLPRPRRPSARDRRRARGARRARLRPGLGALHLRHAGPPQGARGPHRAFLGTEDTILYGSCFDANGGLFETLLGEEDAIISDALNHASIIDGVRLCKAERRRYAHDDMDELEQPSSRPRRDARLRLIATDGVFSMDGDIAPLAAICDLAEHYGALVMVDDSPRHRLRRPDRPRHAGALRGRRTRRHHHRHARQGARRRQRRLHERPARGDRAAAPALAAVPVLQQPRPADRRRQPRGARPARGRGAGAARAAVRPHARASGASWPRSASTSCRASTRSCR